MAQTDMHEKNQRTEQKTCTSTGCIKSKDRMLILEKEEILKRWNKYIGELFHDKKKTTGNTKKYRWTGNIKNSKWKQHWPNWTETKQCKRTVKEMIKALDDFNIDEITEIISEIDNSGDIVEHLSRSIFIALPKKPGTNKCEFHWTIILRSHITKLITPILIRVCSRIRLEIGQEQCVFVKDTETRNMIFMLRMLSERSIQLQRDVYLCFIDYMFD